MLFDITHVSDFLTKYVFQCKMTNRLKSEIPVSIARKIKIDKTSTLCKLKFRSG